MDSRRFTASLLAGLILSGAPVCAAELPLVEPVAAPLAARAEASAAALSVESLKVPALPAPGLAPSQLALAQPSAAEVPTQGREKSPEAGVQAGSARFDGATSAANEAVSVLEGGSAASAPQRRRWKDSALWRSWRKFDSPEKNLDDRYRDFFLREKIGAPIGVVAGVGIAWPAIHSVIRLLPSLGVGPVEQAVTGIAAALMGAVFGMALFGYGAHEWGHYVAGRLAGGRMERKWDSGTAVLKGGSLKARVAVAAGGPVANGIYGALLQGMAAFLVAHATSWAAFPAGSALGAAVVNYGLAIGALLPISLHRGGGLILRLLVERPRTAGGASARR